MSRIILNQYNRQLLGPQPELTELFTRVAHRVNATYGHPHLFDKFMGCSFPDIMALYMEDFERVLELDSDLFVRTVSECNLTLVTDVRRSLILLAAAAADPESTRHWYEVFPKTPKKANFLQIVEAYTTYMGEHHEDRIINYQWHRCELGNHRVPTLAMMIEFYLQQEILKLNQPFKLLVPEIDVTEKLSFMYHDTRVHTDVQLVCQPQTDLRQLALDDLRYDTRIHAKMLTAGFEKTGGHVLEYHFGADHPTHPGALLFYLVTNPYLEMAHGGDKKAWVDYTVMKDTVHTIGSKIAGLRRSLKTLQEFSIL